MTPEERQKARERADAATPGPWLGPEDEWPAQEWAQYSSVAQIPGSWNISARVPARDDPARDRADAEFIAHARTDLPAALDALDAADKENEQLREALRAITDEATHLALRCDSEWAIGDQTFREGEAFDLADAALALYDKAPE